MPHATDAHTPRHRHLRLNFGVRVRRGYAWIAGPLLIGVLGVGLALGCDYASHLNRLLLERFPQAPLLIMPFGFALIVYLVRRFFRGAQGGGIAQTIAAINDQNPQRKRNLLSLRILFGKAVLLMAGFFVGGSIGREGPAVQIGASLMHTFYGRGVKLSADKRRQLIIAGGAAGIAVAFCTPLSGIVLGLEELGKQFAAKIWSSTLWVVAVAALAAVALTGQYTYFGQVPVYLSSFRDAGAVIACGILGGLTGGLFSRLTIKMAYQPPRFISAIMWNRPIFFAGFCGVLVAILGMATDNLVFGSGYEATNATLHASQAAYAWYYGPAKFAATFLCGISGIPAGMFAPALAIGAGLGDGLSGLWPSLGPHSALVLLMMAAYLSGMMRTPLTAAVITMEMTNSYHLLLPILAAVLIANGISKLFNPTPMYAALAERFMPPSPDSTAGKSTS